MEVCMKNQEKKSTNKVTTCKPTSITQRNKSSVMEGIKMDPTPKSINVAKTTLSAKSFVR